jgi:hypothetical protein
MATDTKSELESFHEFIASQLKNGEPRPTPEECLRLWRAQQQERIETIAAVREGLDDVRAGRTRPLEKFDAEFRKKHRIPEDA